MYVIAYNPISKSGTQLQNVISLLEGRGIRYIAYETKVDQSTDDIRNACIGSEKIIIIGGDGTVNLVVNALIDTDIPIAIVPNGTGNDIARSLGIIDSDDINYLVDGEVADIDTWSVNDETLFSGFVTFGLPVLINDINKHSKEGYKKNIPKETLNYVPHKYNVIYDNGEFDDYAIILTVQNIGTFGGGLVVCNASTNDGLLDLVIVKKKNKIRLLMNVLSMKKRGLAKQPNVFHVRTKELTIATDDRTFMLDGEERTESAITVKYAGKTKFVTKRTIADS